MFMICVCVIKNYTRELKITQENEYFDLF